WRSDADDGKRQTIERDGFAHRSRVKPELALPIPVADHSDWVSARDTVFLPGECPSCNRLHAQHREVASRNQLALGYTGFAVHLGGKVEVAKREHPIENMAAVAELGEGRIRKRIGHNVRRFPPQENEMLRMGHGERPEENGVD